MRFTSTFSIATALVAMAMCGTALAQTATKPVTPVTPMAPTPAVPARPPKPAVVHDDRAPTEQEELALAALEGLMAQPAERALPIVKRVLGGSQSTLVKRRALFVLSQIDSPESYQILLQTSRSADPALRGEAVRAIGIGGDTKALEGLRELYATGDGALKSEVLQAWMIADRKDLVFEAARNAKTEEEAEEAIRMLGVMNATEELRKLGDKPNAPRGLVDAYAISGDLVSLRKIAEGTGDRSVRLQAVRQIGIIDSLEARTALREIYARGGDAEIREAALQGMLISGDEQGVLTLYRAAKTTEEKRTLMRYLSMMDGDAALQAIDAALEEKK